MRLTLVAIACLAVGIVLGLGSARSDLARDQGLGTLNVSSEIRSGPRIVIEESETYNFGTMTYPGEGAHEFVVRNEGDAVLTLAPGEPTCRCTGSTVAERTVPPGGSTKVSLTWKPKPEDENFHHGIDVETNDPTRKMVHFRAVGRVVRALRWLPEVVSFSSLTASDGGQGRARIYGFLTEDLQVTHHEFLQPITARFYSLDVRPLTADELTDKQARSGVELIVTAKRGLPLGTLDQTLKVETNIPDAQAIEFRLLGKVASDISLLGANVSTENNLVNFETLPRGAGATINATILVKGPRRNDVQIKVKSVDPAEIVEASLGEAQGHNTQVLRYPLRVTISPDAPNINRLGTDVAPYGTIVLETTHPDVPQLVVKVRFAIE